MILICFALRLPAYPTRRDLSLLSECWERRLLPLLLPALWLWWTRTSDRRELRTTFCTRWRWRSKRQEQAAMLRVLLWLLIAHAFSTMSQVGTFPYPARLDIRVGCTRRLPDMTWRLASVPLTSQICLLHGPAQRSTPRI